MDHQFHVPPETRRYPGLTDLIRGQFNLQDYPEDVAAGQATADFLTKTARDLSFFLDSIPPDVQAGLSQLGPLALPVAVASVGNKVAKAAGPVSQDFAARMAALRPVIQRYQAGAQEAADELVSALGGLVNKISHTIARKARGAMSPPVGLAEPGATARVAGGRAVGPRVPEDFIQTGYEAVLRAAQKIDPNDPKFQDDRSLFRYFVSSIVNQLNRARRREDMPVTISSRGLGMFSRLRNLDAELTRTLGRAPTDQELAAAYVQRWPRREAPNVPRYREIASLQLADPTDASALETLMTDPRGLQVPGLRALTALSEGAVPEADRAKILQALDKLTPNEKAVFAAKLGIHGAPADLSDPAIIEQLLGKKISKQRVHQLYTSAKNKIAAELQALGYDVPWLKPTTPPTVPRTAPGTAPGTPPGPPPPHPPIAGGSDAPPSIRDLSPNEIRRAVEDYARFVVHGDPRVTRTPDPEIVRQLEATNQHIGDLKDANTDLRLHGYEELEGPETTLGVRSDTNYPEAWAHPLMSIKTSAFSPDTFAIRFISSVLFPGLDTKVHPRSYDVTLINPDTKQQITVPYSELSIAALRRAARQLGVAPSQ